MRGVAISFGPSNCILLGVEGTERMVRMIFNDIIVYSGAFLPSFRTSFYVNSRHVLLQYF